MADPARIALYTYKEGLLSRLAHDLRLTVHNYTCTLREGHISARFDPRSIHVDGVVEGGALNERTLSEHDRQKIEHTLCGEVLRCDAHPEILLEGRMEHAESWRFVVRAELTLAGKTASIDVPLTLGDRVRGDVEIVPSRWGIAPFRAMAGALKVQDRVRIVIDLPVTGEPLNTENWKQAHHTWSAG